VGKGARRRRARAPYKGHPTKNPGKWPRNEMADARALLPIEGGGREEGERRREGGARREEEHVAHLLLSLLSCPPLP